MAQRASIARGLALNSEIMLFDEPFSALDAMTKVQLQEELLKIQKEKSKTIILVTHDIEESVYLGDRVVVMADGIVRDIIPIDIEGKKIEQIQSFYPIRIKYMITSLNTKM